MWKRLILPFIVAVILALALFSGLVFNLSFLPGSTGSKGGLSVKELERPATKPARRAGKILPVENKTIVGVFEQNIINGRTEFEQQIDKKVAVVSLYQAWADQNKFPKDWVEDAVEQGKIPMITWEPWEFSKTDFDQPEYRLSNITAGQYDEYIREWLTDVRDWRGPIFVRFAHEMNGDWYPWGRHVNTPKEYVAAWRHVVDLSRELGADNITWVWSPNEVDKNHRLLDEFYPGKKYVDWIGVSGFNWSWSQWRSFSQIFDPAFNYLKKYDKPLMIAEVGVAFNPRVGKQTKAAWITETMAQIKNNDPPIAMVVWFNDGYVSEDQLYNWRIDDSPDSIKAMKTGLDDPAFIKSLR